MKTVAALAAALALAGTATAAIVVQKGIGGVTIGMTQAQVRAKLGTPTQTIHRSNDFGPYTQLRFRGYTITFQGNSAVTNIETTLASERTARGIGVGSTKAQVRAMVAGVHCEGPAATGHCSVGRFDPGARVTDFSFRAGRVSSVVVGIVID
jgi:hypothetical protein